MTASANDLGAAPDPALRVDDSSAANEAMLAEIEALAALVGESEVLSDSPVPAPTASIARSRPLLVPPVRTAPPPVPTVAPPTASLGAAPSSATGPVTDGALVDPPRAHPPSPRHAPPGPPSPYPSGILSQDERLLLLDVMPVAAFLIDSQANVRYSNVRTAEMIGVARDELIGRSVLDFICVEDLDFAAELLTRGGTYGDRLMGPSRIRYVDTSGEAHWTQVWAQAAPPELGVDGYVIALTNESVRDVLATAVSSVAGDDTLDHTLEAVALSARALPFDASGAVLMNESTKDGDVHFRMIGDWALGDGAINAPGTPWREAYSTQRSVDIDDVAASDLTPAAREVLLAAGVRAMFVRPIAETSGHGVGVLVVFRDETGAASPNQNDHLDDAVGLAGLAFAQKRRRTELEVAATTDALTGVGNRAAFNERVKTERRAIDVLFVDLDDFKTVNDTHGHDVGDQVLMLSARRLEEAVRQQDTVYRTGGDEFVVLCESSGDDPHERIARAGRIVESFDQPFSTETVRLSIGVTVGIAAAGERPLTETVRAADRALYRAKATADSGWAHDEH